MSTPSRPVLNASGRPAVRAGGRALVFDASGECAECCGGGGDPGIRCCGPLDNCGFTQQTDQTGTFTNTVSVTNNAALLYDVGGILCTADTLNFSLETPFVQSVGSGCTLTRNFDFEWSRYNLINSAPPTFPYVTEHRYGGGSMSLNMNPSGTNPFPVGPSNGSWTRTITSYPSGARPSPNKTWGFGGVLRGGKDGITDRVPQHDYILYGMSLSVLYEVISGKWAVTFTANDPGGIGTVEFQSLSATANVSAMRTIGNCVSGVTAVVSWTLVAGRSDIGFVDIDGAMTLILDIDTIGPCTSGESSVTDCGCGCGGECS